VPVLAGLGEFLVVEDENGPMRRSGSWLTSVLGAAGTALLVCSVAYSQTAQTSAPPSAHGRAASNATKTTSSSTHHIAKSKSAKSRSASPQTVSRKGKRSKKGYRRGQQKIDTERTHQIQQALIRQHYMTGEPTGKWDSSTEEALRRFQADNGWQNKTVPDSRALIKLGLGPNHDHLLNPESAMTTAPAAPHTTKAPAPGSAPSDPSASPNQPQR
jgi:peptidoglycan hydrolase-like protein with peptidoglycan-binding domain